MLLLDENVEIKCDQHFHPPDYLCCIKRLCEQNVLHVGSKERIGENSMYKRRKKAKNVYESHLDYNHSKSCRAVLHEYIMNDNAYFC